MKRVAFLILCTALTVFSYSKHDNRRITMVTLLDEVLTINAVDDQNAIVQYKYNMSPNYDEGKALMSAALTASSTGIKVNIYYSNASTATPPLYDLEGLQLKIQ